jgi:glutamate racemase
VHLVITDSGLGGLSVCAAVARATAEDGIDARITYVNAWPEPGRGYNDLPDMPAKSGMFDRVLRGVMSLSPTEIAIACNTLSIVYESTEFRVRPPVPVRGIIDFGVDLFHRSMIEHPDSSIVLLGTRTTIQSGVHRRALVARGIAEPRIAAAACHGLAAAIERDPRGADTARLIDECTARAGDALSTGQPSFAGFCCTHYAFVTREIVEGLARRAGRDVRPLDPNTWMAEDIMSRLRSAPSPGGPAVRVLSKVPLPETSRERMAALIERVSPQTAAALRAYSHRPDLF